jgi:hypothetical protein
MAINIRPDGNFEIIYAGPYTGINVQRPENLIADTDTPASNDFIFRNAELRSRPAFFQSVIPSPNPATSIGAIGMANKQLWALAGDGIYHFTFATGLWTKDSAAVFNGGPTSWRLFNNLVWAGIGAHLSTWDALGGATLDNATINGGATTLGAVFVNELDNHLVMANVTEKTGGIGTLFGQRVRWSATNQPTVWDPTVNVNAGFNDFIDVPDEITGLMMLGRVGYILRTDGITEMDPTGQGTLPFQFNHLWASQLGIGNTKFFASAQYGLTGVIISRDNIYAIQSYQLSAIGGNARDAILTDIGIAGIGSVGSVGVIVPYFISGLVPDSNGFGQVGQTNVTFPYLTYMLFCNLQGGVKVWVYSFDEQNWTQFFLPGIVVTGQPSIAITNPVGQPTLMVPATTINGSSFIGVFDPTNFNDPNQGSSHSFKVEDILPNMYPTVSRVILTYRDLGPCTVTASVTGANDNGQLVTANKTQLIGNAVPTKALLTSFFDLTLPAFRPQLTISKTAGAGPLSISTATMIGHVEKVSLG